MRVCRPILAGVVTRRARLIAAMRGFQLVIRRMVIVHRMAGDTTQRSLLETSCLEQAIELTASDSNHAIGPEKLVEEIGRAIEDPLQPRLFLNPSRADDGSCGLEIVPRPVTESVLFPSLF